MNHPGQILRLRLSWVVPGVRSRYSEQQNGCTEGRCGVTAREEWRRLHAVQELFAALAPLSEAARDRYLDSRAELPVETIAKVRSLLGVDTVTALPAMDPLVPDAEIRPACFQKPLKPL